MKAIKLLIILTAFLIMISSVLTLVSTPDRTPVYVNVAAMACLVAVVALQNFQRHKQNGH